jgi:hypothetical protein
MTQVRNIGADIENFLRRAEMCRVEAEMTSDPGRRQERLETAFAYERMAERARRQSALTHLQGAVSIRAIAVTTWQCGVIASLLCIS